MQVAALHFVSAQTNGCGSDNGGITLSSGFCATILEKDPVLEKLATSDKATIVVEGQPDGKMLVISG